VSSVVSVSATGVGDGGVGSVDAAGTGESGAAPGAAALSSLLEPLQPTIATAPSNVTTAKLPRISFMANLRRNQYRGCDLPDRAFTVAGCVRSTTLGQRTDGVRAPRSASAVGSRRWWP